MRVEQYDAMFGFWLVAKSGKSLFLNEEERMNKKLIIFCLALAIAVWSIPAYAAAVVIGDWEQQDDGWIDWGNGKLVSDPCNMPTKTTGKAGYQYDTIGATLNSKSLHVTQTGYGQSLSIKLQSAGHVADFMAHNTFSIDFTVAAGTAGGWNELYAISFNAQGYGWHDIGTAPLKHYDFWNGSGVRTSTVTVDYSVMAATITKPLPSYAEIIIALNSGSSQDQFYFDNVKLSGSPIPEPATIALLSLGGLALLRKRA